MVKNVRTLARSVLLAAAAAAASAPLATARAEFANPDGVAVIVGNRNYVNDRVPSVDFAHRDAEAFKRYVLDVLGYDPENIIDLRDATKVELETTFGNEREHGGEGDLWSYLNPEGGSDVVVYYSGHGVPGQKDGRGYLLPSDAHADTAEINGFPIDVLYGNLAKLTEARSVTMYLDACFSGDSPGGTLVRSASPVYVEASLPVQTHGRFTVLTAASKAQLASWDEEAGHGAFTHHLLDALYGKGDRNQDGRVTAREVKRYLDRHMTRAVRRKFKRRQRASLIGRTETVVAIASEGTYPARPMLESAGDEREGSKTPGAGTAAGGPADGASETSPLPVELAAAREMTLDLVRADRTMVQRSLASLGFDVGAADGKFGPRTRGAIRDYQAANGKPVTGFLTRGEVDALVAAVADAERREAARRAEEARVAAAARLERERLAEEEARRAEEERLARERLAAEERGREKERRADEAAFALAEQLDTIEGFEQYRLTQPQGRFLADAFRRETELREESARRELQERLERERLAAEAKRREEERRREEARRAERAAHARAIRVATVAAYDDYLRSHRDSPGAAEIRGLRAAAVRRAEERTPGRTFRDCRECPEMVVVPAGSYLMGSPRTEMGRSDDEGPQRRVSISEPLAVGRYEVTFAEWESCFRAGACKRNPDDQGWGKGRRPVVGVRWKDARAYVKWLSRKTGEPYRLLTEAEWEYAARAGSTSRYSWGRKVGKGRANCSGCKSEWDGQKRTAPVGSFPPNPFGLHDVHGNVWEWTEDCWRKTYEGAPVDGSAYLAAEFGGKCVFRTLRGGSWLNRPWSMRSANRSGIAYAIHRNVGLRVARDFD
ncbi:MAG: SUMF1/EgtB/PvdO family nonheme iron enzyme [Immundisolibacterales bacterium]|nr:SUMF1/EgtB/PvdO family nonheme iron enzyme [Immundisolibacterales bacterium]